MIGMCLDIAAFSWQRKAEGQPTCWEGPVLNLHSCAGFFRGVQQGSGVEAI